MTRSAELVRKTGETEIEVRLVLDGTGVSKIETGLGFLDHMLDALARNWGLILLRGILAIIFGVLAFVWPGITLISLVLLYGAFAFMDGILAIAAAVRGGLPAPRWWLALIGIFGIAAGILTVLWPQITALVLLLFIAGWAIATGIMQIIGAIKLREEIDDEWLLIAGGVLSVVFGVLLALSTTPEGEVEILATRTLDDVAPAASRVADEPSRLRALWRAQNAIRSG